MNPIRWTPKNRWEDITTEDVNLWTEAYPALDVRRELMKMTCWLVANPKKAHKSNWRRFVVNWLSRQQDRGGDERSQPVDPKVRANLKENVHVRDYTGPGRRSLPA